MTPLADAMKALGLSGEVSRSGRWVRFNSEQGFVYVIEAAWGGGYHAFCDAAPRDAPEFFLDPVAAIQAGLQNRRDAGGSARL